MKRTLMLSTLSLVSVLATSLVAAPRPSLIHFQARLHNANNSPVTGSTSLDVAIFGSSTGGSSVWSESLTVTAASDGLVAVLLGGISPIPDSIYDAGPLWLEITVNGETLTPRQSISSVPYAIRATSVAAAEDVAGSDINPNTVAINGNATIGSLGEWLGPPTNIAGPTGNQGATGPQGPVGPTGPQGPAGAIGPTGPAGLAGSDGDEGPEGAAGPTGTVQGPVGSIGPTGPEGDQGPAGAQGPVGSVQGPQGPVGTIGPQGVQGPIGVAGTDNFVVGPQGNQGPVGLQGPVGSIGNTGPDNVVDQFEDGVTGAGYDVFLIGKSSVATLDVPAGTVLGSMTLYGDNPTVTYNVEKVDLTTGTRTLLGSGNVNVLLDFTDYTATMNDYILVIAAANGASQTLYGAVLNGPLPLNTPTATLAPHRFLANDD